MANTFYNNAFEMDSRATPWPIEIEKNTIDAGTQDTENGVYTSSLVFMSGKKSKMYGPHSIMNDNVAINYRTITNAYSIHDNSKNFTQYSDYLRCMTKETFYQQYLKDKRNPTYQNIIKYYNDENFDPEGLSKYKLQDFIYLKYFNQIPNNYMLTLRRYTRPVEDHVFGLDMNAKQINTMNGYSNDYFAIATAVTYMGEQTGNKLSDILKFDYGANWEDKTAQVETLQSSDGGLAAQMKQRGGVSDNILNGTASFREIFSSSGAKSMFALSVMSQGKGIPVNQAMSAQHNYEEFAYNAKYGEEFYGDLNVVQNTKMRSRGLTFSNNFSLTFEYSLKSLKCVNPRIAMMDILSNFLILTGNYGSFWGGATIFYGNRNIAPQFGDPSLLRQGKYGQYMSSLWRDVKEGFQTLSKERDKAGKDNENAGTLQTLLNLTGNILKGGFTALLGNIFGGNVGVAGTSQVTKALLSGAPSGYWHLTVGNPLDPIAMMGNMAVTKTTVQFNDILGYDDFPTEIKFTVDMEHCRPRDNANIESMFNAGKGRFYTFTDNKLEKAYHSINPLNNFVDSSKTSQQAGETITVANNNRLKIIGGQLNT